MAKAKRDFYVKWNWRDWKADAAVTKCSPATRAIWFDWLMEMADAGQSGWLESTLEQLAQEGRCSMEHAAAALVELVQNGVADVQIRGELMTDGDDFAEILRSILRSFCADSAPILRSFYAVTAAASHGDSHADVTTPTDERTKLNAATRIRVVNRRMARQAAEREAAAQRKAKSRDRSKRSYDKRRSETAETSTTHREPDRTGSQAEPDRTEHSAPPVTPKVTPPVTEKSHPHSQSQSQRDKNINGQSRDRIAPDVTPKKQAPPKPIPPPPDHARDDSTADARPTMLRAVELGKRWLDSMRCQSDDCRIVFRVAWLTAAGKIPEHWATDTVHGMGKLAKRPANPVGYFRTAVVEHATKAAQAFPPILAMTPPPQTFPETYADAVAWLARAATSQPSAAVPRPELERVNP